jgi:RNA polymerase-binding transcription factor DksA
MAKEKDIREAIDKVMEENKDMSVANPATTNGETVDKQVLIRASESGTTLSAWIRDSLNKTASESLDCPHPLNSRRFYPWAEICLACSTRLKEHKPKTKKQRNN